MDVDAEVEGKLAQALGCLGTADRDTLIRQFRAFLTGAESVQGGLMGENGISDEAATFFLDMSNWNLQQALGAFYDFAMTAEGTGNPSAMLETLLSAQPDAVFLRDATVGEGESVPRSTRFQKLWRVRNPKSGPGSDWPPGCSLKHIEGILLADVNSIAVPRLAGGQETDLSIAMTSPSQPGVYESRWQLNTAQGVPFGEAIWCIIVVEDGGLLGITQQMASTSTGLGVAVSAAGRNPFASVATETPVWELAVDRPASPNGSTALHAAVSAAVPRIWPPAGPVSATSSQSHSQPMRIPDAQPPVPPSTPITPPGFAVPAQLSSPEPDADSMQS